MNDDKARFLAKYGNVDIDKELDHNNPNPNKYVILRHGATNAHAVKLLHHPNTLAAPYVVFGSAVQNGHRMIKKSDLQNYLKQPNKPEQVRFIVKNALDTAQMYPSRIVPFHPEDKE